MHANRMPWDVNVVLLFDDDQTKAFGGVSELYIDGELIDQVDMPLRHISTYSLAQTFNICRDTGTHVSDLYAGPFEFNGALDRVTIKISEKIPDPAIVPGI